MDLNRNGETTGEKENPNIISNGPEKNFRTAVPQILATLAKNLILLTYGMTLGFPTIVIPALSDENTTTIHLTKEEISWFGSINLITVPLGCLVSGLVTQPFGRKRSMQALNIPFFIVWLMFYYSESVGMLYASLALSGLAGGLLEAPVLTYVAEITQPHLRGFLSATSSLAVIIGIFTQFLMGTFLNWRTLSLINSVFPALAFLALCFIPESPHWLIGPVLPSMANFVQWYVAGEINKERRFHWFFPSTTFHGLKLAMDGRTGPYSYKRSSLRRKGRLDDAEKSLCWLRGWRKPAVVKAELEALVAAVRPDLTLKLLPDKWATNNRQTDIDQPRQAFCNFSVANYRKPTFYKPFCLIALGFFTGHFCGMTTLTTYAVNIFATLGSPVDSYFATMVLGIVQMVATLVCVLIIHSVGKRPIVFVSTIGSCIFFGSVGIYAYFYLGVTTLDNGAYYREHFGTEATPLSWVPLVALLCGAFTAYMGIRPLPWVLIGEVYPPETRAFASGASGGTGYIFGFATSKTFFTLIDTLTLPGVYILYSCVAFLSFCIFYFCLPETEGWTLLEIQEHFAGERSLIKAGKRRKNGGRVGIDNPAPVNDEVSKL